MASDSFNIKSQSNVSKLAMNNDLINNYDVASP